MANVICGGMKTLGVALEMPGKTNQILADTEKQLDNNKLHFVTEKPLIKFDAPALTETADLPIYAFPHTNVGQRNKWAVDCIFEWSGKFEGHDKTIVKNLANDFHGNTDWSNDWDDNYNDHVKGLIAKEM